MQHNEVSPADELGDESRQFALLLDSVTDYAIYMLDPRGYIRTWNRGGSRIKGYDAADVIGTHFSRFYTAPEVERGVPARNLETSSRDGRFEAEGWRVRKDGSRFRASVVIDPIWKDDRLLGYAKVTRDITERYKAELQLQEAQQALMQAQKMEAIGKLTLGLAHDFNNLLTVIVNSLDLIGARTRDEAIGRYVMTAMRGAERGVLLTRQLLTFGSGQTLALETTDVNELLAENIELLQRAAGDLVHVQLELADDPLVADIDRAQFEAAVLNLVSNSRDALPPSGGSITITASCQQTRDPASRHDRTGHFVVVEVVDDGPGIPLEHQARVFEPFFTTKEVGQGSGLGLSQVFGFASQSGGFVQLRSQPGHGTAVTIHLPAREH
ncbi:PAS domain S-box protein [Luteimonas yindakuii]|uniref:two-component system sensor histidine kinase NtrB n=1 Tax=Luteimonas yindakuii TaxID=2565782 RepID=UPI0010A53F8D|nr:ATP-binding protein [Luteimonas yindakuii]QCO67026.1 PAS domain S-box protein [Luteimonas yindakuii]